jgi:hypothetical protein
VASSFADEAIRNFVYIVVTSLVMGGPFPTKGAQPYSLREVFVQRKWLWILMKHEWLHFFVVNTRCDSFSYGGPQALPGGAKPDSSGRIAERNRRWRP